GRRERALAVVGVGQLRAAADHRGVHRQTAVVERWHELAVEPLAPCRRAVLRTAGGQRGCTFELEQGRRGKEPLLRRDPLGPGGERRTGGGPASFAQRQQDRAVEQVHQRPVPGTASGGLPGGAAIWSRMLCRSPLSWR